MNYNKLSKVADSLGTNSLEELIIEVISERYPDIADDLKSNATSIIEEASSRLRSNKDNAKELRKDLKKKLVSDIKKALEDKYDLSSKNLNANVNFYSGNVNGKPAVELNRVSIWSKGKSFKRRAVVSLDEIIEIAKSNGWTVEKEGESYFAYK